MNRAYLAQQKKTKKTSHVCFGCIIKSLLQPSFLVVDVGCPNRYIKFGISHSWLSPKWHIIYGCILIVDKCYLSLCREGVPRNKIGIKSLRCSLMPALYDFHWLRTCGSVTWWNPKRQLSSRGSEGVTSCRPDGIVLPKSGLIHEEFNR